MRYFLIWILAFMGATATAQVEKDTTKFKLTIKPVFGFDRLVRNENNQEIHVPSKLATKRSHDLFGQNILYAPQQYVDFPQTHWSFFGGVDLNFKWRDFLSLQTGFIGENQASSFGVLGFDDFIVYPRLILKYNEEIELGKNVLGLEAVIGDLVRFRSRKGLMVYNIDAQGGDVRLSFNNFYYGYTSIADLSQHIGLSIGEINAHRLGYSSMLSSSEFNYDLGLATDFLYYNTPFHLTSQVDQMYSIYASLGKEGKFETYLEVGYRDLTAEAVLMDKLVLPETFIPSFSEKLGVLIGAENHFDFWRSDIELRSELRYYGRGYAKYLFKQKLLYRGSNYYDYDGEFLYPLANAYRPISQFAVFSEFQDFSISGLNFQLKSLTNIYGSLHLRLNLETMTLHTFEDEFLPGPFTYWLYESGFVYKITDDIEAYVFISNKVMNLDLSYQTFYQSQLPLFGYAIRSQIPY